MTSDSGREADDALVGRVRKLLDKAAGTDNVHEAEAFAEKAAELVAAHRISGDRLDAARRDPAALVDRLDVDEYVLGRGPYVRARFALLDGIGRANDVRVVYRTEPDGMRAFAAGHRSDLDIVALTYDGLDRQAATQLASIRRPTGASTQRFRRAFLFGFAERIAEILAEARSAVEQAEKPERRSSTAVALRERIERVDEHVAQRWPSVRSARAPRPVSGDGWTRGAAAADRADVGRTRLAARDELGPGAA